MIVRLKWLAVETAPRENMMSACADPDCGVSRSWCPEGHVMPFLVLS